MRIKLYNEAKATLNTDNQIFCEAQGKGKTRAFYYEKQEDEDGVVTVQTIVYPFGERGRFFRFISKPFKVEIKDDDFTSNLQAVTCETYSSKGRFVESFDLMLTRYPYIPIGSPNGGLVNWKWVFNGQWGFPHIPAKSFWSSVGLKFAFCYNPCWAIIAE